jgi:hypothetical protein
MPIRLSRHPMTCSGRRQREGCFPFMIDAGTARHYTSAAAVAYSSARRHARGGVGRHEPAHGQRARAVALRGRAAAHRRLKPPSLSIIWPVIQRASSLDVPRRREWAREPLCLRSTPVVDAHDR